MAVANFNTLSPKVSDNASSNGYADVGLTGGRVTGSGGTADFDDLATVAAFALGQIGPEAKGAVPALIETLKDQNEEVGREIDEDLPISTEDLNDTIRKDIDQDKPGKKSDQNAEMKKQFDRDLNDGM